MASWRPSTIKSTEAMSCVPCNAERSSQGQATATLRHHTLHLKIVDVLGLCEALERKMQYNCNVIDVGFALLGRPRGASVKMEATVAVKHNLIVVGVTEHGT